MLPGLYSAFANVRVFSRPSYTQDGSSLNRTRILGAAANLMLTETLSKVNRPDFPLNWQSTERMPKIDWKTGTYYGSREAWSIGYKKHYTVGVWWGNFSAIGVPELSGATIANTLLFKSLNSITSDRY